MINHSETGGDLNVLGQFPRHSMSLLFKIHYIEYCIIIELCCYNTYYVEYIF